MGDYLTQADLKGRFDNDEAVAFLTGTENTGVPDSDVLDEVIASAEAEVNMALAGRYETPVSSTDAATTAAVKLLALDVAEARLRGRKKPVSEDTQRQLDRIEETLVRLEEGKAALPGAAVPTSTTSTVEPSWSGSNRVINDDSARIFTRETAAGL